MGLIAGAAIIGASSIAGGLLSAGSKPKIPAFKPIDFQAEQQQAIQQNLAALQPSADLAKKTTEIEQSQLENQLRRAIPGYDQLVQQASKNIGTALKGELSPEIQAQIQRSTAGRALAGGYGGTAAGRALTARDLGLTSMQLQNQGLAQAQNFIAQQRTMGMVQPFSVSSMFITPAQRVNALQQQQAAQYGRDLQAAQVAAMPDPKMAAIGQGISSMGGFLGGGMAQQGMMRGGGGYPRASYNPMNDPELYSFPSSNIGGPMDSANWG
ncbi:hypothetical protein EBT31_10040 [bacterium]|nr:hypothetical protein [bacterium]NBX48659.1 hypothetical protein [bacterium]